MSQQLSMKSAADLLLNNTALNASVCYLRLPQMDLAIRSNSQALIDTLNHYFRHISIDRVVEKNIVEESIVEEHVIKENTVEILCVEREAVALDVPWLNWSREPGKVGKKDAYIDIDEARLIFKVRTGMLFLQSSDQVIAAGPCVANANQVINFVNNQYMTLLQQQGWLICHASALEVNGKAMAFAAFSGGGKSTTMLHLMDEPSINFVSNDRLFLKVDHQNNTLMARGIPKLPRINPGTIVYNAKLRALLSTQKFEHYEALPMNELWDIEEKYDVDVEAIYGHGRIEHEAPLSHFVVLNWSHDTQAATQLTEIDLTQRTELQAAIMKSSGPFYQHANGEFGQDATHAQVGKEQAQAYIDRLSHCKVMEVTGAVDFARLKSLCLTALNV
jgi:HprK-related kinase B